MRRVRKGLLGLALMWVAACADREDVPEEVVLAQVNDETITLAEYRLALERTPEAVRNEVEPESYLQALIDEEVLVQEAVRRGLDRESDFEQAFERESREPALRELYRREGIPLDEPTEEEVRAYFEASPYSREVRFSVVMLGNPEQMPRILEELRGGADFEEVSMRYSTDRRVLDRKADMGYHRWGHAAPAYAPVAEKAFSMGPGEVAGPMHVADGHFLIKVTDVRPVDFEEERENVEKVVAAARLRAPLARYYESLRRKYDLQVVEAGLAELARELVNPSAGTGHGTHRAMGHSAHAKKKPATAPSTGDPSVAVVTVHGDTLRLARCRSLIEESGRREYASTGTLRRHLLQQVCREVLIPQEIDRLEIAETPAVQDERARISRRLLVRDMEKLLMRDAPTPDDNKLRLYYARNRDRYLTAGHQPFAEVRVQVWEDYREHQRKGVLRSLARRLRRQHAEKISVREDRVRGLARLGEEKEGK